MVWGLTNLINGQLVRFGYSIQNANGNKAREKDRKRERDEGREGDRKVGSGLQRLLEDHQGLHKGA